MTSAPSSPPSFARRRRSSARAPPPTTNGRTARMRYMMIYKPGFESTAPPSQEEIVAMTQLIEEMSRDGWLISTDGLQHSAKGARVTLENGKFTITDGPFAEAKEVVGG